MPIDPALLERIRSNVQTIGPSLILSKQPLNSDDVRQLVEAIKKNKTITKLNVSYCELKDKTVEPLANCRLPKLNVSNNEIGPKGAEFLAKNCNLQELDISNNQLGNEGMKYLSALPRLRRLFAHNNSIGHEGIEFLVEKNVILNELHIKDNPVVNSIPRLCQLPELYILNISQTEIKYHSSGKKVAQALAANKTIRVLKLKGVSFDNPHLLLNNTTIIHLSSKLYEKELYEHISRNRMRCYKFQNFVHTLLAFIVVIKQPTNDKQNNESIWWQLPIELMAHIASFLYDYGSPEEVVNGDVINCAMLAFKTAAQSQEKVSGSLLKEIESKLIEESNQFRFFLTPLQEMTENKIKEYRL